MTDTRKGFTLVELLAVIVILAIIMIIAIPSVLGTMTTARQKTFCEYVTKVYEAAQNQYLTVQTQGQVGALTKISIEGSTAYVFDIEKDIGISSTGSFHGYVLIIPAAVTTGQVATNEIYVFIQDGEYMTAGSVDASKAGFVWYTEDGEPEPGNLLAHDATSVTKIENAVKGTDANNDKIPDVAPTQANLNLRLGQVKTTTKATPV